MARAVAFATTLQRYNNLGTGRPHARGRRRSMSLELSEEQRRALDASPEAPLRLIDPRTREAYVLLRADQYENLRTLLPDNDIVPAMYSLLAELQPEDWEDAAHYGERVQE